MRQLQAQKGVKYSIISLIKSYLKKKNALTDITDIEL